MNAVSVLNTKGGMVAAGVIVGGIVLYVLTRRAAEAATDAVKAVGQAVNPINPENIFYSSVSAVGSAVAGRDWSLGSAIYDWLHPVEDPNAAAKTQIGGKVRPEDKPNAIARLWE